MRKIMAAAACVLLLAGNNFVAARALSDGSNCAKGAICGSISRALL